MTSRQGTLYRSLNLVCAVAFVFLTYVDRSDAQSSSRRSGDQVTTISPTTNSPPPQQREPQSTPPTISPIGQSPPIRIARANRVESPMARDIRNQLNQKRSFQTGVRARPSRSRALYDIRNERKQQDTQTVEELLAEMDQRATRQSGSTYINPNTEPETETRENPGSIEPAVDDQQITDPQNDPNPQWRPQSSALNSPNAIENPETILATESSPQEIEIRRSEETDLSNIASSLTDDLLFFEHQAIKNHPTLNASLSRILTAQHEALQAGLAPNPRLGLFIDEAGNEDNPGLWGAYLQRNHIRGNKLALGREIKNREANVLEVEFETQAIRIRTDVRTAFYKLLIAKEKMALMAQLFQAQQQAVAKSKQLFDAGETPRTDVLQTELQLQRTQVLLSQLEITTQNAWRELASVVGDPELQPREINGDLNPILEPVSFEECRTHILNHSPELQSAQAEMERIRYTIQREIAETVPDYQTQLTVGRDSTTNHFYTGLQIQIPLQICDQNQGNIAAAKSRLVTAQNDLERIKLDLSKRLASEYRQYESALAKTNMYMSSLLPKSQQTLELLQQGYPSDVSFLQLSIAQQAVIDITLEYLDTLSLVWESRLKIEGLLLDDSLAK